MKYIIVGVLLATLMSCGRQYQSLTVTEFNQPIVLSPGHSNPSVISMLEMFVSTDLNRPVQLQLFGASPTRKDPHYRYTLPAQDEIRIDVDWYSPEIRLVFISEEAVSGSIKLKYFF